MLVVFFKSIIIFFVVFIVVRLMGKREIGEMQPFELVITLIIAEVACIPMNDPYIPIYTGIIPIVTLGFLQILFSVLSRKSVKIRKFSSGTSIMVIDKNGINYKNLAKLNMNVNDLIGMVRGFGVIDIMQVAYAIVETSGKISVFEKDENAKPSPPLFPLSLIVNGVWEEQNLRLSKVEKVNIIDFLRDNGVEDYREVIYCDIRQNGIIFASHEEQGDFSGSIKIEGGNNW